ncbi:MAG TPA: ABC transporter ATP-binding protein [Planctomycetota bacterium]|nr:ABC transporter ATP-binding protein [Planctomycetota bacterium]
MGRRRKWKDLFRYASEQPAAPDPADELDSAPVSLETLKFFLSLLRSHRFLIGCLFLLALINQAMGIVIPVAIGKILDLVLPTKDGELLRNSALLAAAFLMLRSVFLFAEREVAVRSGWVVVLAIRNRLHAQMQRMSLRFLEDYHVGRIVARVLADTESVRHLLLGGFVACAANFSRFVLILCVLYWIDWQMALISTATLPLFLIGFSHYVARLRPAYHEMNEDGSQLWGSTNETFSAARIVKTYCGERRANAQFAGRMHQIVRKALLIDRAQHWVAVIWEVSAWFGLVALIWYGGWRVQSGLMSTGDLFAFWGLLGQVQSPIADLIHISGTIQHSLASLARITALLRIRPDISDRPGAIKAQTLRGEIELRDVHFTYRDATRKSCAEEERPRATINGISLKIHAGEFLAVVGPSGSGKSTLLNLLARLYEVDGGAILVDGVDIRDYQLTSYRRQLALVLQDSILFRGSIRENIRYSRPDATEEEIIAAAKSANAWEFISKFPHGLDSICGERGVKLSGGQKQRISIARAILANPRILMLDEATSALDTEAEACVQQALSSLMRGRTTIVVAHRLSTITHADRIMVLDGGEIVEIGSHEDLMLREGMYYDMFMRQYGRMRNTRSSRVFR